MSTIHLTGCYHSLYLWVRLDGLQPHLVLSAEFARVHGLSASVSQSAGHTIQLFVHNPLYLPTAECRGLSPLDPQSDDR